MADRKDPVEDWKQLEAIDAATYLPLAESSGDQLPVLDDAVLRRGMPSDFPLWWQVLSPSAVDKACHQESVAGVASQV